MLRIPTPYWLGDLRLGTEREESRRNYPVVPLVPPGLFMPENLAGIQAMRTYLPEIAARRESTGPLQQWYERLVPRYEESRAREQELASRLEALRAKDVPYREPEVKWWELAIPALAMIVASPGKKGAVAQAAANYFGGRQQQSLQRYLMEQERLQQEEKRLGDLLEYYAKDRQALQGDLPAIASALAEAKIKELGLAGEARRAALEASMKTRQMQEVSRAKQEALQSRIASQVQQLRTRGAGADLYDRYMNTPGTLAEREPMRQQALLAFAQEAHDLNPDVPLDVWVERFGKTNPPVEYGTMTLAEQAKYERMQRDKAAAELALANVRRTDALLPLEIAIRDARGQILRKELAWIDPLRKAQLDNLKKDLEVKNARIKEMLANAAARWAAAKGGKEELAEMGLTDLRRVAAFLEDNYGYAAARDEALAAEERQYELDQFLTKPGTAEWQMINDQLMALREERKNVRADMRQAEIASHQLTETIRARLAKVGIQIVPPSAGVDPSNVKARVEVAIKGLEAAGLLSKRQVEHLRGAIGKPGQAKPKSLAPAKVGTTPSGNKYIIEEF